MRNSMLIAAMLALVFTPVRTEAQEPHWIFEVPVDLRTLNQGVSSVRVLCKTLDHPTQEWGLGSTDQIGIGESQEIALSGDGSFSGAITVPVRAINRPAGLATHYICSLNLDWNVPAPNQAQIGLQPRSGTEFVVLVTGTLP